MEQCRGVRCHVHKDDPGLEGAHAVRFRGLKVQIFLHLHQREGRKLFVRAYQLVHDVEAHGLDHVIENPVAALRLQWGSLGRNPRLPVFVQGHQHGPKLPQSHVDEPELLVTHPLGQVHHKRKFSRLGHRDLREQRCGRLLQKGDGFPHRKLLGRRVPRPIPRHGLARPPNLYPLFIDLNQCVHVVQASYPQQRLDILPNLHMRIIKPIKVVLGFLAQDVVQLGLQQLIHRKAQTERDGGRGNEAVLQDTSFHHLVLLEVPGEKWLPALYLGRRPQWACKLI
mmetsp:Transcript_142751/g.248954  ORF Transcript_142751/g.248954 Transcript_142751/m.248954 type:complete len:282 (+) Transcript_142751:1513-2358(+)